MERGFPSQCCSPSPLSLSSFFKKRELLFTHCEQLQPHEILHFARQFVFTPSPSVYAPKARPRRRRRRRRRRRGRRERSILSSSLRAEDDSLDESVGSGERRGRGRTCTCTNVSGAKGGDGEWRVFAVSCSSKEESDLPLYPREGFGVTDRFVGDGERGLPRQRRVPILPILPILPIIPSHDCTAFVRKGVFTVATIIDA